MTLEQKMHLCALINTSEAMTFAINEVNSTKGVTQNAKRLLSNVAAANLHFNKEVKKQFEQTEYDFLLNKSSLLYEFALYVNIIPNENIDAFSDEFSKLVEKYRNRNISKI